jgi:hypothetical protein
MSLINLQFDKESHIYTIDGRVIPSVTQVLKDVGIINISPFSGGPETGTIVHEATEQYDIGLLQVEDADPKIKGYLQAYLKFLGDTGFNPIMVERRVYHHRLNYAGTIDRYGDLSGKPALLDIFTGVNPRPKRLQLVAYRQALLSMGYDSYELFTLRLKKDGRYSVDIVNPRQIDRLWNVFCAALAVYNFKKED